MEDWVFLGISAVLAVIVMLLLSYFIRYSNKRLMKKIENLREKDVELTKMDEKLAQSLKNSKTELDRRISSIESALTSSDREYSRAASKKR